MKTLRTIGIAALSVVVVILVILGIAKVFMLMSRVAGY